MRMAIGISHQSNSGRDYNAAAMSAGFFGQLQSAEVVRRGVALVPPAS